MMKYEGKVTISLEDNAGVKISRPFDVEFDEDLTLGESPFLFKKAINIVDRILYNDIEQVTLDAFARKDAAEKEILQNTADAVNSGALDTPGCTVTASVTRPSKKKKGGA